jgi:hypothetical protein
VSFFLTEYEMNQAFVVLAAYLVEVATGSTTLVATAATSTGTQEKGKEKVYVSGVSTITLPSAAGLTRYSPRIVNVGGSLVTILPDGTDTISGVSGSQTLNSQWSTMILKPNEDGTGWIAENRILP